MGDVKIPVLKRNDNFYQMDINEIQSQPEISFTTSHGYVGTSSYTFKTFYYGSGQSMPMAMFGVSCPIGINLKTGIKLELSFDGLPYTGTDESGGKFYMALFKMDSYDRGSSNNHYFHSITVPMPSRTLVGVNNGRCMSEPTDRVIFELAEDVKLEPNEKIYVMFAFNPAEHPTITEPAGLFADTPVFVPKGCYYDVTIMQEHYYGYSVDTSKITLTPRCWI